MKNKSKYILFFMGVISGLLSCDVNLNPKISRLFVVQEIKLDRGNSFFWFRDVGQITHEGLSYFQFASDRCDLSLKKANAYCNEPIQIFENKGDTVFVLTLSEIVPLKFNEKYKIRSIAYSNELYEVDNRTNKEHQYFLDSLCKK